MHEVAACMHRIAACLHRVAACMHRVAASTPLQHARSLAARRVAAWITCTGLKPVYIGLQPAFVRWGCSPAACHSMPSHEHEHEHEHDTPGCTRRSSARPAAPPVQTRQSPDGRGGAAAGPAARRRRVTSDITVTSPLHYRHIGTCSLTPPRWSLMSSSTNRAWCRLRSPGWKGSRNGHATVT